MKMQVKLTCIFNVLKFYISLIDKKAAENVSLRINENISGGRDEKWNWR